LLAAFVLLGILLEDATAEPPAGTGTLNIRRSRHLLIHTDLNGRDSQQLISRLEAKLRIVSRYWAQPLSSPIECFIVDNTDLLPLTGNGKENASMLLRKIGGYAVRGPNGKPLLLANDTAGIAEHELIHAYCMSAFRSSGPDWYREGMACYFSQRWNARSAVHCDEPTMEFIRNSEYRSIREIVENTKFTAGIASSLNRAMLSNSTTGARVGWDSQGDRELKKAIEAYRWSWALCQFLAANKNYSADFRRLGLAYLNGNTPQFDDYFAGNRKKLEAEFREFTTHVCDDYRVDLCRWDFEITGDALEVSEKTIARVQASLGWQSSKAHVAAGSSYRLTAAGKWQFSKSSKPVSVAKPLNSPRKGSVVAAILHRGKLSEPFLVHSQTSITPMHSGLLVLRCNEPWDAIGDNQGTVGVRIERTK
jgi:hypothetical protein